MTPAGSQRDCPTWEQAANDQHGTAFTVATGAHPARLVRLVRVLVGLAACVSLLLPASTSWASGADLESATDKEKATASGHYTQGMASFQAGDAAGALEQFELSYEAVRSPNSHLMVGKALIDLGRYPEAYRALRETVEEAEQAEASDPKYAQTRRAAEEELKRVEQEVVLLSVSIEGASSDATVSVNDTEYARSEFDSPVPLAPGPLKVELMESGNTVASQTLDGRAGETLNVNLSPDEDETEAASDESSDTAASMPTEKKAFPHRRETAYVAAGLGAAGAITFGVFGLLNNGKFSDVDDRCDDNVCPESARSDAERGHTFQTVANVGLIVGVVGLGTAVTLFLTEDDDDVARRDRTRLSMGPGHVMLKGTF